jgi:hypothetical protein
MHDLAGIRRVGVNADWYYIANVNEPSISPDGGQPAGQFFPARPKRQRQQIAQ